MPKLHWSTHRGLDLLLILLFFLAYLKDRMLAIPNKQPLKRIPKSPKTQKLKTPFPRFPAILISIVISYHLLPVYCCQYSIMHQENDIYLILFPKNDSHILHLSPRNIRVPWRLKENFRSRLKPSRYIHHRPLIVDTCHLLVSVGVGVGVGGLAA